MKSPFLTMLASVLSGDTIGSQSFGPRTATGPRPFFDLFDNYAEGGVNKVLANLEENFECPGCADCSPSGLRKTLNEELDAAETGHDQITVSVRRLELAALDGVLKVALDVTNLNSVAVTAVQTAAERGVHAGGCESKLAQLLLDFQKAVRPLIEKMVADQKSEVAANKEARKLKEQQEREEAERTQLAAQRDELQRRARELDEKLGGVKSLTGDAGQD